MPAGYVSGKFAIAECDRCAFRYKLVDLRIEIIKTKPYQLKVCRTCWDPDHPQLQLGMYPVNDPQALRNPRRDTTYSQSGVNNAGMPGDGSRQIQWGWYPVGMAQAFDAVETPNDLVLAVEIGTVTVSIT